MTATIVSDLDIAAFLEFGLSLEAWNRANPNHPKDAKGRWTKGSAVGKAIEAGESTAHFSREALMREVRRRNREGADIKVRRGAPADEIRAALGAKAGKAPSKDDALIKTRLAKYRGDRPDTPGEPIYEAQLAQASTDLARDRANQLAELEELLFINESDDFAAMRHRFDASRKRLGLADDALLDDVSDALGSKDPKAIATALGKAAEKAGLERIGGDLGESLQVLKFDRTKHQLLGESSRGMAKNTPVELVRPGFIAQVKGQPAVLEKAVVAEYDGPAPSVKKAAPKPVAKANTGKPTLDEVIGRPRASSPKTVAAAQKIYGGAFGGLNVKVTEATNSYDGSFIIAGDITNADGHRVGTFTRTITRPIGGGEPYATHGTLYLQKKVHGQGFAEGFNANAIDWYRANGVKSIKLYAADDVGGYAWARANYDFADKTNADAILLRALEAAEPGSTPNGRVVGENMAKIPKARLAEQKRLAEELFDRSERTTFGSVDYPTPYEISQLGRWPGAGKDDMWIGKAIMLGSSWKGVRYL